MHTELAFSPVISRYFVSVLDWMSFGAVPQWHVNAGMENMESGKKCEAYGCMNTSFLHLSCEWILFGIYSTLLLGASPLTGAAGRNR